MKVSNDFQIINCNEISSDEIKQQNIASLETSITNKGIKIYRKLVYNQEIKLESMTTKLAHKLFIDFKNDEMLFEDKKAFHHF